MVRKEQIHFRVNEDEKQRYKQLVKDRQKPLGAIIRETLDRMAEEYRSAK